MGLFSAIGKVVKSAIAEPEIRTGADVVKHYANRGTGSVPASLTKRLAGRELTFRNGMVAGVECETNESGKIIKGHYVANIYFENPEDKGKTRFCVFAKLGDSVSQDELLTWNFGRKVTSVKGVVRDEGTGMLFYLDSPVVTLKKGGDSEFHFNADEMTAKEVLNADDALECVAACTTDLQREFVSGCLKKRKFEFTDMEITAVHSTAERPWFEFNLDDNLTIKAFYSKSSGSGIAEGKTFKKVSGTLLGINGATAEEMAVNNVKVMWE